MPILDPWCIYYFSTYPGRKYHIPVYEPRAKMVLPVRVWWNCLSVPTSLSLRLCLYVFVSTPLTLCICLYVFISTARGRMLRYENDRRSHFPAEAAVSGRRTGCINNKATSSKISQYFTRNSCASVSVSTRLSLRLCFYVSGSTRLLWGGHSGRGSIGKGNCGVKRGRRGHYGAFEDSKTHT